MSDSGVFGLTVLQPWAWLIANGYKDIESRQWFTPYRGKLVIHAGKKILKDDAAAFRKAGIPVPADDEIDLGCCVAVAVLRNVRPLLDTYEDGARCAAKTLDDPALRRFFGGRDRWTGDTYEGTFAWELGPVHAIKPVPWRGNRKLWAVPTELLEACRRAYHELNPPKAGSA